jgi:signal transduction histidine kinase
MKRSGRSRGEESRSPLIVVLLLASLIVVAILAVQAQYAVQSHRAMAESVLRGYAGLAGDEFTRRATTELGFYGYYQAITALREAESRTGAGPLPAPHDVAARANDETKRALALARTFYRFDPATGRLETSGPPLTPAIVAWLRTDLAERGEKPLAEGRRYDARYAQLQGSLHAFVTLPAAAEPGGRKVALGFAVERDALAEVLRRALAKGPLLPISLGGNELGKDAISLVLADPFGEEILRAGPPFTPVLGAEKRLGSEYGGILDSFVLRTSIDQAAAPKLAIGGLPRSRLPVLIALMILTAGLTLTAGLQLRRERLLGRLRSDFVSRVSHELRTPLTQIGCSPRRSSSTGCAARTSGRATSRSSTARRGASRTSSKTSCDSRAPRGERSASRPARATSVRSCASSSKSSGPWPREAERAWRLWFMTARSPRWTTMRSGRSSSTCSTTPSSTGPPAKRSGSA